MIVVNANDLARTRLCQAAGCHDDAEPRTHLCAPCARRRERLGAPAVPIHETPERAPDMLWCSGCHTWKPDNDFHRNRAKTTRRGRHAYCQPCAAHRRHAERARTKRRTTTTTQSPARA